MRLPIPLVFLSLLVGPTIAVSAQDIFVTPIPGAPFSAVVHVERTIVRDNGSVANVKTDREIGRDSRGRIYNEARQLLPLISNNSPELLRVHLYDPETRISTILDAQHHTFWTRTVNRPPETLPPQLHATPTGSTLPQSDFAHQEDLGTHEMNGVLAHGVRDQQTIADGAGKSVVVTDEYWYSEELRINVIVKHDDPGTGKVTLSVGSITRTEPDPARFEIPQGYKRAGAGQQ